MSDRKKATQEELAKLRETLEASAEGLKKTGWKKMFGCDAIFANGNIFGLVWKEGRIGIKLPDPDQFEKLMALEGASPWQPGGKMTIAHWVLIPSAMNGKKAQISKWLKLAHQAALSSPPKK